MSIKEILKKINIQAEDKEIRDFLKHSEACIGEFFKERWDMFTKEQQFMMQVKNLPIQLPNAKKDK